MKRDLSDYIVALAVIACSLVLLGALTLALTGYSLRKPVRTLEIDFVDATGVKVHSEVRYAGARAGRVISMRHLTPDERSVNSGKQYAVRITASIDDSVPPIPADVDVTLSSDTLLSEKFVSLSAGTPDGRTLPDGAHLYAKTSFSIDTLLSTAGPVLENANVLIRDVRKDLTKLLADLDSVATSLGGVAGEGKTALEQATVFVKRAQKLIGDNEGDIHSRLKELETVLTHLNGVVDRAGGFISNTDHELNSRLEESRVVVQNLKVLTTHAKAITQTLGERPWRLIWGSSKPNKLQPEERILESSEPLPSMVAPAETPKPVPVKRKGPPNRP